MDSTSIDLCASLFDWARYKRTKGAAKLHLLLDHDGYLPAFACISDGKTSDIRVARQFQFAPGTVVVMDRAYVDYDWWESLTKQGVFFVTRFKSDLKHEVVVCRFSVKWKEAFSVSVNSALRAGIFKAFGSFDPMWFWEERGR